MRSANPSSLPVEGSPGDSLNARLRDWQAEDPDHLVGASAVPATGCARPKELPLCRLRVTIVDPDGYELTFTQKIEDRS